MCGALTKELDTVRTDVDALVADMPKDEKGKKGGDGGEDMY